MAELLKVERILVDLCDKYVIELGRRLQVMENALAQMDIELEQAKLDPEAYVSNPVKAFSLIRRMQADWVNWELFLKEVTGHSYLNSMKTYHKNLSTALDLEEAVTGMHRLQIAYDMRPEDIAVGLLNGKRYDSKLTARDLYTIGFVLFKHRHVLEAGIWLKSALDVYLERYIYVAYKFSKKTIYELYANILTIQARDSEALMVLNKAIEYEPRDARVHKKKRLLEYKMKTTLVEFMKPFNYTMKAPEPYYAGCRGEFSSRPQQLHCLYNSTTNAFLKLAPLKMEEISLEPYMVLYHDVITDSEIEHLKEIARPNLERAPVYNKEKKAYVTMDYRTTKAAGIPEDTTNTTLRIHRRIADMTGFILTDSDMMQLINYGLAGHYDEHADFHNFRAHVEIPATGNRIATVMIYLSDVEQGGATVFPKMKVAIPPQKGAALVWYNLDMRGDGDYNTKHAACPVIVGSKWIVTKWIRESYQFNIRPCPKE